MNKNNKGITLIALVITIVVLLILAAITINFALSEGGILGKANQAKEKQEVAEMLDRLTVAEASTATNYLAVDLEKYKAELKAEGIVKQDESNYIASSDGLSYELTSDKGYVFTVTEPTKGDIIITYEGKVGQLPPKVIDIKAIEKTASSIKTQVNVARLENGTLSYYYKKASDADYITFKKNTTEKEVNFTGLTQNQIYTIKVVAQNSFGKSNELIMNIVAGELQSGTISQKGTTAWANGQASIELQTTMPSFEMQYQINSIDGKWLKYAGAITGLKHNDVVYARLWDGMNGSATSSIQVIDNVLPQDAIITLSNESAEVGTKVTATITQKDEESEIDISKCKWILNTSNTVIGTDETNYTSTFTNNPQTIDIPTNELGTYYLHVLTIDKARNKKETISKGVTVEIVAPYINDLSNDYLTQNTLAKDTTNKIITIPSGFKVVKSEAILIDKGIVIEDKKGNQFVWVLVPDPTTMYEVQNGQKVGKLYDFSRSGGTVKEYPGKNTGFREPDVVTADSTGNGIYYDGDTTCLSILGLNSTAQFATQLQTEFDQMITSVEKYKGFYIGRYSTGNLAENISTEPVVKRGQTAIGNINWYYAYQNSKKIANGNSNITTSMIWGCQWDRTLQWLVESGDKTYAEIVNSHSWGNHKYSTGEAAIGKGVLQPTGTNEAWKANNIYDLAGNIFKWTIEASDTINRIYRGGSYGYSGSDIPVFYRGYVFPSNRDDRRRLSRYFNY